MRAGQQGYTGPGGPVDPGYAPRARAHAAALAALQADAQGRRN
jgi:hypothetical protein